MDSRPVYIYALINPINKNVFYVGATVNPYTRLLSHIGTMSHFGNKKQIIIDNLIRNEKVGPEMFILDTTSMDDAGYWEVFYTDLYRSFGFDLSRCIVPYKWIERKRGIRVSEFNHQPPHKNDISKKIDGKDIHYYRRLVFKHFKFYQRT